MKSFFRFWHKAAPIVYRYLPAILICLLPTLALAATVETENAATCEHALTLSTGLYNSLSDLLTGPVGQLVGLACSATGFLFGLLRGFGTGNIILILTGLLVTALPSFFLNALSTLESLLTTLGSGALSGGGC